MRQICGAIEEVDGTIYAPLSEDKRDRCGKLAVDHGQGYEIKFWLCAEHWDSYINWCKKRGIETP